MPVNRQPGDLPTFTPGEKFSASKMNRLADEVRSSMNIEGEWPIEVLPTGTGYRVRLQEAAPLEQFYAKITAVSSGKYSWTEQFVDATGAFIDNTSGRVGTTTYGPAYERNSYVISSFPVYALLTRRAADSGSLGPVYDFDVSGAIATPSASITVKDDKAHTRSPVTTIKFNNATASALSGGQTDITIDDADYLVTGLVSDVLQYLGGGSKGADGLYTSLFVIQPNASDGTIEINNQGGTFTQIGPGNDIMVDQGIKCDLGNGSLGGMGNFQFIQERASYGDTAFILQGILKACFAIHHGGTIHFGIDTVQNFLEDLTTTKTMTVWGGVITDIS